MALMCILFIRLFLLLFLLPLSLLPACLGKGSFLHYPFHHDSPGLESAADHERKPLKPWATTITKAKTFPILNWKHQVFGPNRRMVPYTRSCQRQQLTVSKSQSFKQYWGQLTFLVFYTASKRKNKTKKLYKIACFLPHCLSKNVQTTYSNISNIGTDNTA